MNHSLVNEIEISHIHSPFTKIFEILTKYIPENKPPVLAYDDEQLIQLREHMRNSSETLLQGVGSVGHMLSAVDPNAYSEIFIPDLGRYISATCNLIGKLGQGLPCCMSFIRHGSP